MKKISLDVAADGIATLTLNDPDQAMNVVSPQWLVEMEQAIAEIVANDTIIGVILTSAKSAFMAGADLKYILGRMESGMSLKEAYDFSQQATAMHRNLEKCGKPVVAVINGLALGGGFELALACHGRLVKDDPRLKLGLPEVTVGLLAGSGGTQRLPRLIGIEAAIPAIVDGKTYSPAEALALGMVDQVVPEAELMASARAWLKANPDPVKPWDKKGYQIAEGQGLTNSKLAAVYAFTGGRLAAKTWHNYPAPIANLDVIFEGCLMPMDKALNFESKHFAKLMVSPVARNIIRTTFVNKGLADKLVRRPPNVEKSRVSTIGILGAGLMGAGIAFAAAQAGLDVVLLDRDQNSADKGKNYSATRLKKMVERGTKTQQKSDEILARISAVTDYAELSDCQLVIEAVFEDRAIKAEVTRSVEAVIPPTAIFASNTSTLPISGLAEASIRPAQFIGLHFFSPVERMPLIEVICGSETSDETLAKALDFVAQMRMTPVVVNDSRGFYTSRVFQTYIHEGMKMLEEGVAPALIENAARMAGMPLGPLALLDEITISLPWKIVQQSITDMGDAYPRPCAYDVMATMVEKLKRLGRSSGGGFYDYPSDAPKHFWSGLENFYPLAQQQPSAQELQSRFLAIQSLETARCMEEGVVEFAADADIGSLMGWSFPLWTGGTLSYIDTLGIRRFVSECDRMSALYGERFKPSTWLRARAEKNQAFYA
tara:strand:- start:32007 stop:34148 length:2142 start_codon:yes stop_codon:yes gene_type:complete